MTAGALLRRVFGGGGEAAEAAEAEAEAGHEMYYMSAHIRHFPAPLRAGVAQGRQHLFVAEQDRKRGRQYLWIGSAGVHMQAREQ